MFILDALSKSLRIPTSRSPLTDSSTNLQRVLLDAPACPQHDHEAGNPLSYLSIYIINRFLTVYSIP